MEGGKMVCNTGKFCHIQEMKGGEMVEVGKRLFYISFINRDSLHATNWTECFFLPDSDHGLNHSCQEEQEDVKSI